MEPKPPIPFIDLASQYKRLKSDIDARIQTVLDHNRYILGDEVLELEAALSAYCGAKETISCANGTDALILPLKAWEVGQGDAVFVPSWSYCASAEAIALLGATPIFVDVDAQTYNMDPKNLKAAIENCPKGLMPKVVMSVDLFGQCANYDELAPITKELGLKLLADSAQGFGSTLNGHHPIHWADVATTSFFPAKPLGCYGDGGAVFTNDAELADIIRSLRMHGAGTDKYDNVRIGLNSRLDTIQATILLSKLSIFEDEIKARNNLQKALGDQGIPTPRYYPKPIHRQTAYADYPIGSGGLAVTEAASARSISLPMHPYLDEEMQDRIISAVKDALH